MIRTIPVELQTRGHCDVKDITPMLQQELTKCGLMEGQATIFVAGSTAGVTTVEFEPGVMKDLGALPGDTVSFALSLNNGGQAVGVGSRAIIWRDGVAIDLNSLVPGPPFSPLYLLYASAINDRGEVAGQGLARNGELHAFLAVPCDEEHLDAAPCNDDEIGAEVVAAATLDGTVNASAPRKSVAMLAGRFGGKSGLAQIPQIWGRRVPAFGDRARKSDAQH